MSDLIDRQAAIDALHMHLMYRMGTDSNKKRLDEWINSLPSAQPKIIWCKDCKKFRRWIDTDITFCDCTESEVKEGDFCSRAERRTNDSISD